VFEDTLRQMRESLRRKDRVITIHARRQMRERKLAFADIERAIFNGRIVQRQKDELTREWKYLIRGPAYSADNVEVAAKLTRTSKLVIITVYVV
jgi:Domain of unknown function (DUF4258)